MQYLRSAIRQSIIKHGALVECGLCILISAEKNKARAANTLKERSEKKGEQQLQLTAECALGIVLSSLRAHV